MAVALVIGGAGYIGSHTCKALKMRGVTPVVYDSLRSGHKWAVKWGPLVTHDILDRNSLTQAFKDYKPDVVLHFASLINVRESGQYPGLYYENNITGSVNLFETMQENGVHRLIFSSSAAVYGASQGMPLTEKSPCNPTHVYGKTKWMVEEIIRDYEKAHGFRSVLFRYFNAAGADMDGEIGEAHSPETHLIPLAIEAALEGQRLNIFGDNHPTPDGTAIRDYVHVADLACAHALAVEYLLEGKESAVLNLGTGRGSSIQEIIDMVEKVTGRGVDRRIVARNEGEPSVLVACAKRAETLLGWERKHSDLEMIVRSASAWHEKTLQLL